MDQIEGIARTERRVALPRGGLHLVEAGAGPPIILLHGWPQHGAMWDPLLGELARDHRVLIPDLRGFGNSDAPPGDYSKHALARDVLDLLDESQIDEATLVGHDWGGWIAWLLALEHPQRVDRFVALDIPPPWREPASPSRIPLQVLFGSYQYAIASPWLGERLVRSPGFVTRFIRAGSGRAMRWSDERLDSYARPLREAARARASVALYRTFLVRELPRIVRGAYTRSELRVPGLALMGGDSAITRTFGLPARRALLEVETVPRSGHFIVDEAPSAVLGHLQRFIS